MPAKILISAEMEHEIVTRYTGGEGLLEIGRAVGVSHPIVSRVLRGAEVRVRPGGKYAISPAEEHRLVALYESGLTMVEIAAELGCKSVEPVKRVLRQRGVRRHQRGSRRPAPNGYLYEYVGISDPLRSMAKKNGSVLQHRLVMARHLGRPLRGSERVHHRNGIRHDNRVENLELWQSGHPNGQRVTEGRHCPTCTCGGHAASSLRAS